MPQVERLTRLKNYLDAGRCLSTQFLIGELDVSPATLTRDMAYLRDRMNAPVFFDRYELPGLWLTAEEIHALLTIAKRGQLATLPPVDDVGGPDSNFLRHRAV